MTTHAADPESSAERDPLSKLLNNPYTDAEIAETLAPYHFRILTQADLATLPAEYTEPQDGDRNQRLSEVSGWAHVNGDDFMVLYRTPSGAATGDSCLPLSNQLWIWKDFFKPDQGGEPQPKPPSYWHGKYVRLVGRPQFSPQPKQSEEDGIGGGWTMYPPLSLPDQQDCNTEIGFFPLEVFLGR